MHVEWVNHAGFVLACGQIRIMVDPWIDGLVFDESWAHLAPTAFRYSDFETITHIWFSHEHPDHFFPPNLKRIAPEVRANIHILFQPTRDGRVADFCRQLNFASVTELPDDWYPIGPGLEILCHPHSGGDSWAAFRTATHTLLNLNDCIFLTLDELKPVQARIGRVDTLVHRPIDTTP